MILLDHAYSVQLFKEIKMAIPGAQGAKALVNQQANKLDTAGVAQASENSQNAATDTAIQSMETANANQNKMAAASANFQTQGLARSTMLQAIRDVVKDGKDVVKDGGEAGHKP
jgi:uncharacterized protein YdaT